MFTKAISPFDNYCDGYGNPGANGGSYVLALTLGVAKVNKELAHDGSKILDEILAFDKAEVSGPYIGQINMIQVSSFCGPNGLIWGFDIAKNNLEHIIDIEGTPVYSAEPLVDASASLFGTIGNNRFPILPGAHVPCAGRQITLEAQDNTTLYAGVGIGIPKDRQKFACVLMEDAGLSGNNKHLDFDLVERLATSVLRIGAIQRYEIEEVLVGLRKISLNKGEIGCALVAAPYISLAKKAIPRNGFPELRRMSLSEWEQFAFESSSVAASDSKSLLESFVAP